MINTIELRRKRAAIVEEAEGLISTAEAARRELTSGERVLFDERMAQARKMLLEIEQEEASQKIELANAVHSADRQYHDRRLYLPDETRRFVDDVWARSYLPDGIQRHEVDFGRMLRSLVTGDWRGAEAEKRLMTIADPVSGGHLVPEPLAADIIGLALNKMRVRQAGVKLVEMPSASLKTASITALPTAEWLAEDAEATPSDFAFGSVPLVAKKVSIQTGLSIELFEDAIGVPQTLTEYISLAIALEMDRVALVGDAENGEPVGVLNADNVLEMPVDGMLESYAPFSQAWGQLESNNATPTALIMAPRSFAELDALLGLDGQPLKPPESWANYQKLPSSQVPINLNGTDTVAFLADWRQLMWGIRTEARIELNRFEAEAWKKYRVLLRIYLRGDIALSRPAAFCKLTGIAETVIGS